MVNLKIRPVDSLVMLHAHDTPHYDTAVKFVAGAPYPCHAARDVCTMLRLPLPDDRSVLREGFAVALALKIWESVFHPVVGYDAALEQMREMDDLLRLEDQYRTHGK